MSAKSEKAAELFSSNFNCAQSVFAVFCEDYGMDIETGLKVAGAFGGAFAAGNLRCGFRRRHGCGTKIRPDLF